MNFFDKFHMISIHALHDLKKQTNKNSAKVKV